MVYLRIKELMQTDEQGGKMWLGKVPCIIPVISIRFWLFINSSYAVQSLMEDHCGPEPKAEVFIKNI